MSSLNIKQINIGNIIKKASYTDIEKTFLFNTKIGTISKTFTYAKIYFNPFIFRLGYCCSPLAMEIPIYLSFSGLNAGADIPFYVKPNGIFEYMIEEFRDINSVESEFEEDLVEEESIICYLADITVPYKCDGKFLPFTIDYVESIN